MFSVPSITFSFIKDNTDAELLAKPQLRIAEGEKAQLVIGDRVPIPVTTINTQQAVGGTGVIPITSFQYQDVGIKIDMEPRVHHNKEVSLKLTIEVSQITGYQTAADGTKQPIIGTRTITSSIRLKDGETNFLAGLIRKDISKTTQLDPVPRRPPAHRDALLRREHGHEADGRLPDADAAHHPVAADHRRGPHPDLGRHGEQRFVLGPEHAPRVPERDGLPVRRPARRGAARGAAARRGAPGDPA